MKIARLGIALLSMSGPLLAQDLSSSDFEARRRELRERYVQARSPAEKEAILEQFREFQLAQGKGIDEATTIDALQELFPGVDPEVLEALAKGIGIQIGPDPAAEDSPLGPDQDKKPDPRIAELMTLIAWTDYELSGRLYPEIGHLTKSTVSAPTGDETLGEYSKENVEEYREYRDELRDRLAAGLDEVEALERGEKPSDSQDLDDWKHVLSETGAYRRLIASWVRRHHTHMAFREKDRLADLQGRLGDKIESLETITQAMGDAQLMKDQAKTILQIKDVAEAVQKIGEAWANPTSIPAAVVETLADKLKDVATFDADDVIENGIGGIADHMVDVVAAMEGYEDLESLLDSIRSTLDQIGTARAQIAWYMEQAAREKRIEDAPYFFQPG